MYTDRLTKAVVVQWFVTCVPALCIHYRLTLDRDDMDVIFPGDRNLMGILDLHSWTQRSICLGNWRCMKWFLFEDVLKALSVVVCISEVYFSLGYCLWYVWGLFWRALSLLFFYGILESTSVNELPEGFHRIRDYVFSIGLGRVIHFSFTVTEVADFRRKYPRHWSVDCN